MQLLCSYKLARLFTAQAMDRSFKASTLVFQLSLNDEFSIISQWVMPRFGIRSLRRKPDFDREASTLFSRQKQSVCERSFKVSSCSVPRPGKCSDERNNLIFRKAKEQASFSEMEKRSTFEELTNEEPIREQPFRTRRNAICNEIERKWFLQGAYLERHRHNLQVTHELTARGLMCSWHIAEETCLL